MISPIIIIPIYKPTLNKFETISVNRCFEILGNYKIRFIAPQGLDISYYKEYIQRAEIKFLPAKYFKSPQTYNNLLRSLFFFEQLLPHTHMLMYHTDSYVFRDELMYWCEKGYDYIGAPMYKWDETIEPTKYIGVGNGGFSLHNINSAIHILKSWKITYTLKDLNKWYLKYNFNGKVKYLLYYLKSFIGFGRFSKSGFNQCKINEDVFWGIYVPKSFKNYNVADFNNALKFSMEYNCKKLFEQNGF